MYYIYMLRCEDDSIYTGITTDIERRMSEHFEKSEKCAKYTNSHTPKKLERVWETSTKSLASKLEYHIKKLPKYKKENLVKNICEIEDVLSNKVDSLLYKKVKVKYFNVN